MTPPIQEMTKYSGERSENDEMAPELHNSEQIDRASQAQHVAKQAKEHRHKAAGGTESRKAVISHTIEMSCAEQVLKSYQQRHRVDR